MYQCPKCHAAMRTVSRSGIQLEQCESCRGIFLDHGELEALARLESQWAAPPPPPGYAPPAGYAPPPAYGPPPGWGAPHHGHGYAKRPKSFAHFLFSS